MYQKHYSQKGVGKGLVKFRFDLRLNGKRYRKMVVCKQSAVTAIYNDWEKQVLLGLSGRKTIFQIVDLYFVTVDKKVAAGNLARDYAKHGIKGHVSDFKAFVGNVSIDTVKRANVQDYILELQSRGYKNSTVITYMRNVCTFFQFAIDHEYYPANNPASRHKIKDDSFREIELSENQVLEIITKAKEYRQDLYIAVMLALFAGLRRGEIESLTWSNFDTNNDLIVLQDYQTKTGKARTIPLCQELKMALLEHRRLYQFQSVKVSRIARRTISAVWREFRQDLSCAVVNGMDLHFHDLRHIFGQRLLEAGVDFVDISAWLGHTDIKMTQSRYVNIARKSNYDKINSLNFGQQFGQ